jgi:5-methylcytosine-specific restriction protein A
MDLIEDLETGIELTNKELSATFKCGNMGGMRRSRKTNTLVIVSDPFKGLYLDRWFDGVLHYTGMGQSGDQSLTFMQNKTLAESPTNGVVVHLFEVHQPQKYTYVGEVQLAADPYQQSQSDKNDLDRKVWIFPVAPKLGTAKPISLEALRTEEELQSKRARSLSDADLKAKATKSGTTKVGVRVVVTQQYQRNPWVAEYAKRRAAGQCELCNKPAPFSNKAGAPYLEVHHIEWLANGGADSIENTVALCPNCHRRMHVVQNAEDAEKLQAAADQRE